MDNKKLDFIQADSKIRAKSTNQKINIKQAGKYDANDARYIQYALNQQNYLVNKLKEMTTQKPKEKIFVHRAEQEYNIKFGNVKQNQTNPQPLQGDDNDMETDASVYNKPGKATSQHVPSVVGCLLCRAKPSQKPIFVNINYVFDKPRFYKMINQQLAQDCTNIVCDCGNKISTYSLKLIKDEIFYTQLMQNQITAIRDGKQLKGGITKCQSQVCDYFYLSETNKQKNYALTNNKCPICFSNIK
ncbi:hypothetical protein pb186bvf_020148 [Paramecium bursaria]